MSKPWLDKQLGPDERAHLVVNAMTEEEKFSWLSAVMAIETATRKKPDGAIGSAAYYPAIPRLGIPAMQQSDASLGVAYAGGARPGDNATALPSSLLLGAGFDPDMAYKTGAVIGQEARAKGFNVLLAGGANLVREARGGRNFEYVSEDPLLTGKIAGASVKGIQSQNIVSTVKHFVLNGQETGRMSADSVLDEASMRESDLLAFEIAIEIGQPGAVMPGYNLVNGVYATENQFILSQVLKGDWHYPGWVMSDWGATHSTVKAMTAGLDVESAYELDESHYYGEPLKKAVASGEVSQARIDDAVKRQMRSLFAVGAIDDPASPHQPIDYEAHKLQAQRAAENGIILLKNSDNLLPLKKGAKKLLVIGECADKGVLSGGGSSGVFPIGSVQKNGVLLGGMESPKIFHPESPLLAIKQEANAASVDFLDGTDLKTVIQKAADADAVIIFVTQWRAESLDVPSLNLSDDQEKLIETVAELNRHVIIVLESGGAVVMPWHSKVPAIMAVFYPGSGGAQAISGVLFGRVNPSGRLPVTFPREEKQLPGRTSIPAESVSSDPGNHKGDIFQIDYNQEGADVGYRWFSRTKAKPLFPFGYGLSYTRFAMRDFKVSYQGKKLKARITVSNIGKREGAIVVQIYGFKKAEENFVPRLLGFSKVFLTSGERCVADIPLEIRLLARFDVRNHCWCVSEGHYQIAAGKDASTMELVETLFLPEIKRAP